MNSLEALEKIGRINHLEKRSNKIQTVLIIMLAIVVVVPILVWWWISRENSILNEVVISDTHIVGQTDLCPGDSLKTAFRVRADGEGVIVIDRTIYKVTPPMTVIFSDSKRAILANDLTRDIVDVYVIPETYVDEFTGETMPFSEGTYKRLIALSSPRIAPVFTLGEATFKIRADCKKEKVSHVRELDFNYRVDYRDPRNRVYLSSGSAIDDA